MNSTNGEETSSQQMHALTAASRGSKLGSRCDSTESMSVHGVPHAEVRLPCPSLASLAAHRQASPSFLCRRHRLECEQNSARAEFNYHSFKRLISRIGKFRFIHSRSRHGMQTTYNKIRPTLKYSMWIWQNGLETRKIQQRCSRLSTRNERSRT